ncbi:MAG: hydrogenase maturation nickel metallochaperone HypA [Solobacterium sp.]|nr:hydrogenase maturation nickel metallochaperone HypA [Solobacterium sp.]
MHELGIVTHCAKTIVDLAEENHLKKIGSVTLEIGEVSGIMTDYFVDCWNYFKVRYPVIAESELKLKVMPAVTYCEDCRSTYETVKYGRTCPNCGSPHTYLLTGNECIISEVEAEDEDEASED